MTAPWTAADVAGALAPTQRTLWRGVEAQHLVATMRLVDSLAEQELLERILDASKPPLAPAAEPLHYLINTPFRYTSPHASRFRLPQQPGIWYGAQERRTVCAEIGYWRWRFLSDSDGLRGEALITEHTLFQARARGACVDLTKPPLSAWRAQWRDPQDYRACHALAAEARGAGARWIRYESARLAGGWCGAVLDPACLALHEPSRQETWHSKVTARQAFFTHAQEGFDFESEALLPPYDAG